MQDDIGTFVVGVGCFLQGAGSVEIVQVIEIGEGGLVDQGERAIADARKRELGIVE